MSELRYNLITHDWVIIANERAKRPHDFRKPKTEQAPLPKRKENCPFCTGNEGDGTNETFRMGNATQWQTRSIYNKFPALSPKIKEERNIMGPYKWSSGFGVHEVIIEHPDHNTCIAFMKDAEVENIIMTYKNRYISLQQEKEIQSIIIFKNHGPEAGCSLEHPHSQLIAMPVVPHELRNRLQNALEYFDLTDRCIFCHMMELELKEKKRIVLETEKFVSFIPYASPAPFIVSIVPRRHMQSFEDINADEIKDLARNLRITLGKIYYGLDNPDFNYAIRSSPVREKLPESFHWAINIIPRLAKPAGFELGSGMFINTSIPEESAEFLRSVSIPG